METRQQDYTRALRESNKLKAPNYYSIMDQLENKLSSYGISPKLLHQIGEEVCEIFAKETLAGGWSEKTPRFYINLYGDNDTMKRALTNSVKTYTRQIADFIIVSDNTTNKISLFVSLENIK